MSGFAGFCDYSESLKEEKYLWMALARRMASRVSHRGPDASREHVSRHCALAHATLLAEEPTANVQPVTRRFEHREYSIAFNGEIFNARELRRELEDRGCEFQTESNAELVLMAYIYYGTDCASHLNGFFSFVIDDGYNMRTFLCRDRFGLKPLFYTKKGERLAFGSEIKALFEFPGVQPIIKEQGLCELFGLGPARSPGCGVFSDIHEVLPGHFILYSANGLQQYTYYRLEAQPHTQDYPETVATVRALLEDIVDRQMQADIPPCTFLSGGLDSSVVTALMAKSMSQEERQLTTYSFDYEGNETFFKPTSFQPDRDDYWAKRVSELLGTRHITLSCDNETLEKTLKDAVLAKDLPGMADIDAALLYFCRRVKPHHSIVLCGEGADEIFGGYPWFHRKEMFDGTAFPWSNNLPTRSSLLRPEILEKLHMEEYVGDRLADDLRSVPILLGESEEDRRIRQITWMTTRWFMATLLDRQDRCSMFSGMEVRMPFSDHRLVEYVYNVPWAMKNRDGVTKGLLRDAARGLLPEDVLFRKKSPFPKTHNPGYEALLKKQLTHVLQDSTQPIQKLLSKDVVSGLLGESYDYGKPWFGQLMAGPQLLAYLLQINYWLSHYHVYLDI